MDRVRRVLGDSWALAAPYWRSDDRWAARGLSIAVVALNLGIVYLNVLLNQWNNGFYNALQDKNYGVFVHQLVRFSWLAALYIVVAVYQLYLNQMLQIRWRRWLTERYLSAWLAGGSYFRMQLGASETDNPDQRISEDLQLFVSATLGLAIGGLRAVLTLVSFVAILWGLSGSLVIPLGRSSFTLPGYMVWTALAYAVIGTWLTSRIGRPLVRLNFEQQRFEADFRFGLVRFRENAEGIALYHGEDAELQGFRRRFGAVVRNFRDIMRRQKQLTWFTSGYAQAAVIFPFLVAAPRYFRGALHLGGLMQTATAFGQVQDSLSFIVSSYTDIATWRSVVDRLAGFGRTLESVRSERRSGGITLADGAAPLLALEDVKVDLPDGKGLISGVNLSLGRGDTVLLEGPSGVGKSTLVRAIAGIWPFGEGAIRVARGARVLVLPQKPYLPLGTLRDVVSYPRLAAGIDDATLRNALEAVGLPALAGRLDEESHWALQLSPGEQQRIAFARALVHRPDWLLLDEATSAVDEATEARLYRLLREQLPATGIFSVGHRGTLRPLHARELVVRPNQDGPASLVEVTASPSQRIG
jgi:putative ATP-binding cassette transporter